MGTAAALLDGSGAVLPVGALSSAVRTAGDTTSSFHPTAPGLRELLGGKGLKRGVTYAVDGSTSLALALAAGPSAAGSWVGVVGLPTFGSQSAAGLGIDLDRVALVPHPQQQWMEVVAALIDALDLVVVRPPAAPKDAEVRRLSARLRQRGASIVVVGPHRWPGCELHLRVTGSRWHGLGADGHGHLSARTAVVSLTGRGSTGHPKTMRMWLPGPTGQVEPVAGQGRIQDEPPATTVRPLLRSVG